MYKAGVSYEEFGRLNLRQIRYISHAYAEKQEEDFKKADIMAYIQGRYMVDALLCTVGNMLGGKKADFTYPEQAYSLTNEEPQLSEEEIERQREQFIAMLQTMERNFNLREEKEKTDEKAKGSE